MPTTLTRTHRPGTQSRSNGPRELTDYYLAPSHDFTQYTRDYEEKYWSKDTAFDWDQSVPDNLRNHVEGLPRHELQRLASVALPVVHQALARAIDQVESSGLPDDLDAIRAIGESLPAGCESAEQAAAFFTPLEQLDHPVTRLRDQLGIQRRERDDLAEQMRLDLYRTDTTVRRVASDAERQQQRTQMTSLTHDIAETSAALLAARTRTEAERVRVKAQIRQELNARAGDVVTELRATRSRVEQLLSRGEVPRDLATVNMMRDLIWKRQLRGLKDIANHALVVEQSAIAPLTMGIIHYKRRREIQEAMTTFVNDEAKHSAVFQRFMADKLDAKERVSRAIVKGGERYLWLARVMPSAAIFLAVIVEAIGGAYLEFFADEDHMPDPLFRSICRTIAQRDERRHQDLCAETYNELYRRGGLWERLRNDFALKMTLRAAYGDKTEDHHLIQACRAFGMESAKPYRFVASRLSEQLGRVGTFIRPSELLSFMPVSETIRAMDD